MRLLGRARGAPKRPQVIRRGIVLTAVLAVAATAHAHEGHEVDAQCTAMNGIVTLDIVSPGFITLFVRPDGGIAWRDEHSNDVHGCEGATVFTTDLLEVIDRSGLEDTAHVTLDLERSWGPGASSEPQGRPEIEISIDLGDDERDDLIVEGAHFARAGSEGIRLSRDADVDVTMAGVDRLVLLGTDGRDDLSGAGGPAVGASLEASFVAAGRAGGDLIGGTGNADTLNGDLGPDIIAAAGGRDLVLAGAGADVVTGGRGRDDLNGGAGADVLAGGPGRDMIDGGAARDRCSDGARGDAVYRC